MAAPLYIDKLLLEASVRFEEKFSSAKDGQSTSLGSQNGSDRSYNLRTQIQHIPQLQQDKHFMQMVTDIDKYTSPEWTLRGDVEKRLYSLVAGLLKGLLRECISSTDAAMRKVQIEKCFNWYRDKKKLLMEWKLEKRVSSGSDGRTSPQSRRGDDDMEVADGSSSTPDGVDDLEASATRLGSAAPKVSTFPLKPVPGLEHVGYITTTNALQRAKERIDGRALDLNYMKQEEEQQRATDIVKKLQLYKKRNLQKSLDQRLGATPLSLMEMGSRPVTANEQPSTIPRIVYRDKSRSDSLKSAPILMHITEGVQLEQHSSPLRLKHSQEFAEALANVQKIWVEKRAQEAEAKLDEMEFADTVSMWSYNQARVEEEINRRQESYQMSSQTGRTCHPILRRPYTAPHGMCDPDEMIPNRTLESNAVAHSKTLPLTTGKVISLSPYDNFVRERDGAQMRMLAHVHSSHIKTPDDDSLTCMISKGLTQTHPTAIRGTSLLNSKLDITSSPTTTFAPSVLASVGKLPSKTAADPEEETATGKAAKPKAAAVKGGKGAKKGATKKRGPVDPQVLDQIFPILSVEQEVPSIMRMKQMQQVEAIRETFAKYGLSIPTSVIEQGILTPEDRPYVECMTNLPPPESGFVSDFTKKRDKPKAKAAKAKAT